MAASVVEHAKALTFSVVSKCSRSKARVSVLKLPHAEVDTPVFMPVGTQGTLKGMLPDQLRALDCRIMLGNTYHLGHRPGPELFDEVGGLHNFMKWDRALLTDSGGFQMVSLLELAEITEEGVRFKSPHDDSLMMLTPEHSIHIQNSIGADIIMQLDDVVHSSTTGPRLEEAMHRCIKAHKNPGSQNLFAIVQGGLDAKLRTRCAAEMRTRDVPGFAIGGLSGGEEKDVFWRMVTLSTDLLPEDKPRYLMGVGYPVDLVVCAALGCDMYDCVYPTRTARFGTAMVPSGLLYLHKEVYREDYRPIDDTCHCSTCKNYTRAYIHMMARDEPTACALITVHNVAYQMSLMRQIRASITSNKFAEFVQTFMLQQYPSKNYPDWVQNALQSVNISLL